MRVRIDLLYDGKDFAGWAKQPNLRTVQGIVEQTISQVLRLQESVTVTCAGRTDAGVHARGQVIHVDLPDETRLPSGDILPTDDALSRWLGRALPDDVVVRRIAVVPEAFDARFSALWRRYVYRLCDDPTRIDPLERGYIALTHGPLDVEVMADAARSLLGLHDFVAFCRAREGTTSIRTLLDLTPVRTSPGRVDMTVRADAFCHSMVRSLTGALVAVGQRKRDKAWVTSLLGIDHRANDITVMPAHGLTLEEVAYPSHEELAARASIARSRRDNL